MPNRTVSWITKYMNAFRSDASCMRFLALMQLCDPIQFDLLVESLRYYRQLQNRLHWLHDIRQHGVRTLSGGALYTRLYKQRQQSQREYARQRQHDAFDWQQLVHHYENNQHADQMPQGTSSRIYMMNPRRKANPMEISGERSLKLTVIIIFRTVTVIDGIILHSLQTSRATLNWMLENAHCAAYPGLYRRHIWSIKIN